MARKLPSRKSICGCMTLVLISIFMISSFSTFSIQEIGNVNTDYENYHEKPLPSNGPINYTFEVVDVRLMGLNKYEQYVLASIEGIVNKNESRLFVIDSIYSADWINVLNASPYQGNLTTFSNFTELVSNYLPYFSGAVVFNGDDPDEANLASPLCGVYDCLLVPSQIYSQIPGSPTIVVNVTSDLQSYSTRVERYNYAIQNYYPLCNQTAFSLFDGTVTRCMRNFIISESLFTFWLVLYVHTDEPLKTGGDPLDPDPAAERQVFEDFLNARPPNTVIFGFMWPDGANEGVVIKLISEANKYLIAANYIENLPFLSRMILPENYTFQQLRPDCYPVLENKVYITGMWSDGDNIQYMYNYMKPYLWDGGGGEAHGSVPTGWTVNPSSIKLIPYVLKHFYENATVNDYFVGGLSGKGYCKYDYITNQSHLEQFIEESNELYNLTDITEGRVWMLENTGDYVTKHTILRGIFDGYGGGLRFEEPRVVNGVPIVQSMYVQDDITPQLEFIDEVRHFTPGQPQFYFFHLHCWTCNTTTWSSLAMQLDAMDNVEVVRPDVLIQLIRQWERNSPMVPHVYVNIGFIVGLLSLGIILRWKRKKKTKHPR
ncbi:MAG: hypothetical protein ACFFCS_17710 [Candidatus Hodarchaeota archaeon]